MKICSINLWELSFDVDDSLGESDIGSDSRHLDVLVDRESLQRKMPH